RPSAGSCGRTQGNGAADGMPRVMTDPSCRIADVARLRCSRRRRRERSCAPAARRFHEVTDCMSGPDSHERSPANHAREQRRPRMKKLGAAVVILGLAAMTGITWAQQNAACPDPNTCANCGLPQVCCTMPPTALLAYESTDHNSPIFRTLSD